MAHEGQIIEGMGGFRLHIAKLNDELLEMEAHYQGDGSFPPEHLHPKQHEYFDVLSGRLRTFIDGEARTYEAGESFDVPAGVPHTMKGEGPTDVRWQVRPSLRTADFFERTYAMGGQDAQSREDLAKFLTEFSDEFQATGKRYE